jgi:hypothetical protein
VQVAIPEADVGASLNPAPAAFSPEISVETRLASSQLRHTASASTMDKAVAARAAIKAGVLGFFIGMFIPFLAIVVAGALAVFFYRRENGILLPPGFGSRLGGAAGVVAIGIQSIFFAFWIFVFHRQKEYIDSVMRFVHLIGADASIPDIQASIRSLLTPAGLVSALFFLMIVAAVLASLGGALASLFLRPRNPRA